jgi:hypothetical protein
VPHLSEREEKLIRGFPNGFLKGGRLTGTNAIAYAKVAAQAKEIGVDLNQQAKKHVPELLSWFEKLVKDVKSRPRKQDLEAVAPFAASLKALGVDLSDKLDAVKPQLAKHLGEKARERGWLELSSAAAELSRAGLDVKEQAIRHRTKIRGLLDEKRKSGDWVTYAKVAADMAELGLLTPNTGCPQAIEIPPIKKFGGGY